jgi:hypothetical protein
MLPLVTSRVGVLVGALLAGVGVVVDWAAKAQLEKRQHEGAVAESKCRTGAQYGATPMPSGDCRYVL